MDMDMTLHFREREVILFSFWKTGSLSGMAVSMFICFLLCILYEAIKAFRLFIAIHHQHEMRQQRAESAANSGSSVPENSEEIQIAPLLHLSGFTKRMFTAHRIAQGALFGAQAMLSLVLMLIAMTFNGNLILAIVAGEAVGYFLFTGSPIHDSALVDCC